MKIALISDIHGNYEALKSVLADIENSGIEKIICLGDTIGKGINSNRCIELLKKYNVLTLAGNTDTRFLENPEDFAHCKVEQGRIKFNQSLLTEEDKEFLRNLPLSEEFYLSGNLVRLFHATPESCFDFVNDFDKSYKEKYKMFLGSDKTKTKDVADIVIYGHLHYPYMQKMFNKTLICCGSVGNSLCLLQDKKYNSDPGEAIQAHYMVVDGDYNSKVRGNVSFEFKSVSYDIKKELESNTNNPEFDGYSHELLYGTSYKDDIIRQVYRDQGYEIDF